MIIITLIILYMITRLIMLMMNLTETKLQQNTAELQMVSGMGGAVPRSNLGRGYCSDHYVTSTLKVFGHIKGSFTAVLKSIFDPLVVKTFSAYHVSFIRTTARRSQLIAGKNISDSLVEMKYSYLC